MSIDCWRESHNLHYLSPEDELTHSLWIWNFSKLGFITASLCLTVISAALLSSLSPLEIPIDNFSNATRAAYLEERIREHSQFFIGEDGRNQTFLWENYHKNRQMRSRGMLRINFGTTWTSWCHPDYSNGTIYQKSSGDGKWPSLLRIIELNAATQVLLRFLANSSMCTRALCVLFRVCSFRVRNPTIYKPFRAVPIATPFVFLVECFFTHLTTALHQDCDSDFKWLMPWCLIGLGIFSSLTILLFIYMDILDKSTNYLKTFRFPLRILCLLTTILCLPIIARNYVPFINKKLCHPYVDWHVGLIEYLPFISLITFNLTIIFDLTPLTFALTVTHDELYPEIREGENYRSVYEETQQSPVKQKNT